MANQTLNNILDQIEAIAMAHKMVNDYGHGHTADIGTSREKDRELIHPFVWTDYVNTQYVLTQNQRGMSFKIYTLTIIVLDKYSPSVKNSKEVMSDTEGILSDIVQKFANDPKLRKYRIQMTTQTAVPVRDDEKDGVEGWSTAIALRIPYEFCHSDLPF